MRSNNDQSEAYAPQQKYDAPREAFGFSSGEDLPGSSGEEDFPFAKGWCWKGFHWESEFRAIYKPRAKQLVPFCGQHCGTILVEDPNSVAWYIVVVNIALALVEDPNTLCPSVAQPPRRVPRWVSSVARFLASHQGQRQPRSWKGRH